MKQSLQTKKLDFSSWFTHKSPGHHGYILQGQETAKNQPLFLDNPQKLLPLWPKTPGILDLSREIETSAENHVWVGKLELQYAEGVNKVDNTQEWEI